MRGGGSRVAVLARPRHRLGLRQAGRLEPGHGTQRHRAALGQALALVDDELRRRAGPAPQHRQPASGPAQALVHAPPQAAPGAGVVDDVERTEAGLVDDHGHGPAIRRPREGAVAGPPGGTAVLGLVGHQHGVVIEVAPHGPDIAPAAGVAQVAQALAVGREPGLGHAGAAPHGLRQRLRAVGPASHDAAVVPRHGRDVPLVPRHPLAVGRPRRVDGEVGAGAQPHGPGPVLPRRHHGDVALVDDVGHARAVRRHRHVGGLGGVDQLTRWPPGRRLEVQAAPGPGVDEAAGVGQPVPRPAAGGVAAQGRRLRGEHPLRPPGEVEDHEVRAAPAGGQEPQPAPVRRQAGLGQRPAPGHHAGGDAGIRHDRRQTVAGSLQRPNTSARASITSPTDA
jgi:hypothetical protein